MAILSCPQIVRLKTFGHVDSQIVQRQFEFSSAPSERFSYYGAPVAFVPRRGRRLFAATPRGAPFARCARRQPFRQTTAECWTRFLSKWQRAHALCKAQHRAGMGATRWAIELITSDDGRLARVALSVQVSQQNTRLGDRDDQESPKARSRRVDPGRPAAL